jgi:hypothetical protein
VYVHTTEETGGNCSHLKDPKICTKCPSKIGCQGDAYGVGVQGCRKNYKGVMCALCERGFYAEATGNCKVCPTNDTVYQTLAIGFFGAVLVGALAYKYGSLIQMLMDPSSVKIFVAYLVITSSLSTSYDVELPSDYEAYQSKTSFIQLDIQGVMYCMIQSFEFTYYHNIIFQASLPFVVTFLALSALALRFSMIQTHFEGKRKADRKGLYTEKIKTQEEAALMNAQEMIISGKQAPALRPFLSIPLLDHKMAYGLVVAVTVSY